MRKGCPATEAKRLGTYWTTTIGKKSVVVFKSDSHMSQDGPQLAERRRLAPDHRGSPAELVITTGTGGGIGTAVRGRRRHRQPHRQLRLHGEVQEQAVRPGSLRELAAEGKPVRDRREPCSRRTPRSCRRTTARPPKIIRVAPSRLALGGPDDRLLRLRHLRRPLPAARPGQRLRNGRRRARAGRQDDGRKHAALARHPQRLRSADRCQRAHAQAAGAAGRRRSTRASVDGARSAAPSPAGLPSPRNS